MTGVRRRAVTRLAAAVVLLTVSGIAPATTAEAAVPVPGEYFFIQTPDNNHYYLYAANATTGARRRVSSHLAMGRPSVSRTGSHIAFMSPLYGDETLGRYGLYTVRRDGTGLRRMSAPTYAHTDPAWSPSGNWIAFTRDRRGNSEANCCDIAMLNVDTLGIRAVPNTAYGSYPAWSPTGSHLAFVKPDGLYVIKTDGTGSRRLVAATSTLPIRTPEWSPDGRSIAYVHRRSETISSLRVVPAAGGTPVTRWTPSTGHVESPVYGVDGRTIHVTYHRGWGDLARRLSSIYRVPPTGSPAIQVNPAAQVHFLDYHHYLDPAGKTGIGLTWPTATRKSWRTTNAAARPATEPAAFSFGVPTDIAVTGDWNADGTDSPGVVRLDSAGRLEWHLPGYSAPALFGRRGDIPVPGDWNGDGHDTPGVVRVVNGRLVWYFTDRNTTPTTSGTLVYGSVVGGVPDRPVAGDWDGDGVSSPGVARNVGTRLHWFLNNRSTSHNLSYSFDYGLRGDRPIVGDWDGDRDDTAGVTRQVSGTLQWHLRNYNSAGGAFTGFTWGSASDVPVSGDWDGR
jgi:hypothetical protein